MNKSHKFLICKKCGNIAVLVVDSGVTPFCCGEEMSILVPNTTDGALEKHVPFITVENGVMTVQVGEVLHPMLPEHFIAFVYVKTENGGQRKAFEIGESPIAKFTFIDDKPVSVYAYCNIHGLWVADAPTM